MGKGSPREQDGRPHLVSLGPRPGASVSTSQLSAVKRVGNRSEEGSRAGAGRRFSGLGDVPSSEPVGPPAPVRSRAAGPWKDGATGWRAYVALPAGCQGLWGWRSAPVHSNHWPLGRLLCPSAVPPEGPGLKHLFSSSLFLLLLPPLHSFIYQSIYQHTRTHARTHAPGRSLDLVLEFGGDPPQLCWEGRRAENSTCGNLGLSPVPCAGGPERPCPFSLAATFLAPSPAMAFPTSGGACSLASCSLLSMYGDHASYSPGWVMSPMYVVCVLHSGVSPSSPHFPSASCPLPSSGPCTPPAPDIPCGYPSLARAPHTYFVPPRVCCT